MWLEIYSDMYHVIENKIYHATELGGEMHIKSLIIENFKCYEQKFLVDFNESINIIVGNNEAGKSTILEAIHLCLTGMYNGRYLRNELSQYIFNSKAKEKYISSINSGTPESPPRILIEVHLVDDNSSEVGILKGNGNSLAIDAPGVLISVDFNDSYIDEYNELVSNKNLLTIPIEYYKVTRQSFARKEITSLSIPLKSALIDSSNTKAVNGSDAYLSRIIKDCLEEQDRVNISQAHREMRERFMEVDSVKAINEKISTNAQLTAKTVTVSVDLATQNAWESSLMPYLDDIPFHFIGKGEQSIAKTALALSHKKSKEASIILFEEPENHLSHAKLNELLSRLEKSLNSKQLIVTTHSSFVANKLGLDNLLLLSSPNVIRLNELSPGTEDFFKKLPGYDILRLILCSKAILVEGDSDELIVQKAYHNKYGKLPIEDCIDVISVGNSFLRFLEISEKLCVPTAVITDNDGNCTALNKKYEQYIGSNKKDFIDIYFSDIVHKYSGMIEGYNTNTLEPELFRANSKDLFEKIFNNDFDSEDDLLLYMRNNKTKCALDIFNTKEEINFPPYIAKAIGDDGEQ